MNIRRQWFLFSLMSVFVLGFALPDLFEPFANATRMRNLIVASVLFVMALPLNTKSVGHSLRHPGPAFLASAVNMLLLPLVAWGFSRMLTGDMRTGLLVTASVPCTLASAAVWTRKAGGDDTVSVLVTVITNLGCFLITPFLLYVLTGSEISPESRDKLAGLPIRLSYLVLLPMVLAQLVRMRNGVPAWAAKHKSKLSLYCQAGILLIVLAGATQCGLKLAGMELSALRGVPMMCVCALALHLSLLLIGMTLAKSLGFDRPRQIAVGISGSQKTLMVGLDIAIVYFGGLAILPMVAYHFLQLTADTVIAERLNPNGVD